MDRSDLELALAVHDQGSLAGAGRALDLAAPVVTKRLAALESRLGQRLFQRTTRRVSATAEGETFCARARGLLAGFQALEAELLERKSEPTGLIRLAATFGFGRLWLGPALARFQQRYPRVEIQLQLTEQLPDLAQEGYDGAIWLWPVQGPQAAQWVSRRLARNARVLVAAPAYIAEHGEPADVQALERHHCLIVRENTGAGQRHDIWVLHHDRDTERGKDRNKDKDKDRSPALARVRVHGPLSSNSGELVRDWCLQGRGIMLRSLWDIAAQLASGELVRVLPGYVMPEADIHWLAPHRPDQPRRLRLLVDELAAHFREAPWRSAAAVTPPASVRARPGSRPRQ